MTGLVAVMALNRSSTLTTGVGTCGAGTSHMPGFMAVMAFNVLVARFFLLRTFASNMSLLLAVIALNSLS